MRSRCAALAGGLIFLAGVGVLVDSGVSYATAAHSYASHAGLPAILPAAKNLSITEQKLAKNAAWQNSHLFTHLHSQGIIISGSEPVIRMQIPAISVDAPVIQTAVVSRQWQVADWSVGYLQGTGTTSKGNMVFAAHDDIKGEIFKRVGELIKGQRIVLYTRHRAYTYLVQGQQTVNPSDSQVLNPTPYRQVTLITCVPYWVDGSRLVVTAKFHSSHAI
jgi:LPXTG-site transpeptidase (sortase) family protein